MQRSLSIPEWHQMVVAGSAPPVRIQLNGNSMFPLIRYQRDYVTIVPLNEPPVAGDIVLFSDPSRERYVMHRVWQVKDGKALTWGDSCDRTDGWIPLEDIWGKALQVERGGKTIHMNAQRGILWASFWHRTGKVYRFACRIKHGIVRRIWKIVHKMVDRCITIRLPK